MKPSSATMSDPKVVALKPLKPRRQETEFLPAALEIIETPASPAGRVLAGSIALFLAIAIVWSCVGQVDIIATAQGRIVPTGKSKVIQPFDTGVVRRIAVTDGTFVRKGDVLVQLDPTSDESDEIRLTFAFAQDRLDIARLRALLDGGPETFRAADDTDPRLMLMARNQMQAQAAEQAAKLEGLDRQIAQKQAESREIAAAIEKVRADLPLITEQRDIRQALLQNQYGSRLAYLQLQQQLVDSQHDLQGQTQKQAETAEALAALERQKAEAAASYRKGLLSDLAKAEVSANEHAEEIRKAALKRELRTLRAPVDGTVQQLAVHTLGGVVSPAQRLMVVVPKDTGIEIEAALPNKDVGFVHAGQPVEVKIEAFTFTRYGLIHGTVSSLSQDAVAEDDGAPERRDSRQTTDATNDEQARQASQPTYMAHIALDTDAIETEIGHTKLDPGMSVTAEIKTGRRSIISFLLSPLTRLRQEGMRER